MLNTIHIPVMKITMSSIPPKASVTIYLQIFLTVLAVLMVSFSAIPEQVALFQRLHFE